MHGTPVVIDDYPYSNEVLGEVRWYDLRAVQCGDGIALTWRDVTDKHNAAAMLAESEAHFRMLVSNVYGVVVLSVDGLVKWISPAVEALIGYSSDELVGRRSSHLWHPEDLPRALALRQKAQGGAPAGAVLRVRHKDDHYVWVELSSTPYLTSAGEHGAITYMRDVSEKVHAEAALEEREEKYRLLAENAADIVFQSDLDDRLRWVSPSVEARLGWGPVELVGVRLGDLLHREDTEPLRTADPRLAAGGDVTFEARCRRRDGTYRWLAFGVRPMLDEHGVVVGRVAGARDIEDEVIGRRSLLESEELFRTAMRAAGIGMAMVDVEGCFLAVNPAMAQMIRRDPEWFEGHAMSDILHADDVDAVSLDRVRLWSGESEVVTREIRLVRSDGRIVWARRVGALVRDAAGAPHALLLQIEDVTAGHVAAELLDYQAFHDTLTGLRNRAWIVDFLDAELVSARRDGEQVGVFFIDLDNFKVINDSLGHAAGDQLLAIVARRMADALGTEGTLGRFGGDEFVAIVSYIEDAYQAEQVAEGILDALSREVVIDGHRIVPSASMGIALSSPDSTAAGLLRDTDSARFRAKAAGRSRWHFSDEGLHADAVSRLTIEDQLRGSVANRDFVVHYQPVLRFDDGSVVEYEALVRWQHPVRGLLLPGEFLPVAEESGLIVPIGTQVLDLVCADMASRHAALPRVAVNISGVELARPDFARRIVATLERHGLDPSRLVLEVTETAVMPQDASIATELSGLRDLGVGLHVDDFGTGFSSISLLRDLPVTGLKLDRSFVNDLTAVGGAPAALASGLAGLVSGLGLTGIAEGIETQEQLDLLRDLGWENGQGFLLGRPGPLVDDL